MIMNDAPFGQESIDFYDQTSAERVGERIRKIRTEKGLSQAELGGLVGLTADRVQKYENGARKPKEDLLKKIASSLGVSTLALVDPILSNYIGAMFAMFELEDKYDMQIEASNEDEPAAMRLTVSKSNPMYKYMREWYTVYSQMKSELEVASSIEEEIEIKKSYHNWEWTFPKGVIDKTEKGLQKERLKRKIEELKEVYDNL